MRGVAIAAFVLARSSALAEPAKSRDLASALSGGGAGVASAVVVAGFLTADEGKPFNLPVLYAGLGASAVLPSLGEWYGGQWLTVGMAIRTGAAGLALYAIEAHQ